MKKYLTKRNIFFAVAILILIVFALILGLAPLTIDLPLIYYLQNSKEFYKVIIPYPLVLFGENYGQISVLVLSLFIVCCIAIVVLSCLLGISIFKQYRQEHPRKPSNKQRIAELEKQLAELKQNQKD